MFPAHTVRLQGRDHSFGPWPVNGGTGTGSPELQRGANHAWTERLQVSCFLQGAAGPPNGDSCAGRAPPHSSCPLTLPPSPLDRLETTLAVPPQHPQGAASPGLERIYLTKTRVACPVLEESSKAQAKGRLLGQLEVTPAGLFVRVNEAS